MDFRLRYRIDETRHAVAREGLGGGVRTAGRRIAYDARNVGRRLAGRPRLPAGVVVLPIQGSTMALRLDDPGISRRLIHDGIRELEHTQLVHEEIGPGMVGVDLGANLGYYALMEAKLVGPTGRVIAIEPVPDNVEILRQNAELNGYTQMEVHQLAIADTCGETEMWITARTNFCNLIADDDPSVKSEIRSSHASTESGATRLAVPTMTLDAFLEERGLLGATDEASRDGAAAGIDFIRMDIEGYEVTATEGMRRTFEAAGGAGARPLRLFMEVHNNHFVDPCEVVGPWMRGLLDAGFQPRALAVRGHPKPILREGDLSADDFPELLCSFADVCPHVLLVKGA